MLRQMYKTLGADLDGYPLRRKKIVKAILEFSYPEDEDKLRHAIHGKEAVLALCSINYMLSDMSQIRSKTEAITKIKEIVKTTLENIGEV